MATAAANATELGTVAITPRTVVAGEAACYAYVYTAGPAGIAVGGGFEIAKHNHPQMSELQTDDPQAPGYVAADSSGRCRLAVQAGIRSIFTRYARATVQGQPLRPGETITLYYGAPPGPSAIQQTTAGDRIVWDCGVDVAGNGGWRPVPDVPALSVVGGDAHALRLTAPSVAAAGGVVLLRIVAQDAWLNAATTHRGRVALGCTDAAAGFPGEWRPEPGRPAVAAFAVHIHTPGLHRFWARDDASGLYAESNPVVVAPEPLSEQLFWGDLHVHSYACDGIGWPDELFRHARDDAHLDFAAITSHDMADIDDWTFEDMRQAVRRWRSSAPALERASAPAEPPSPNPLATAPFVPFAGYEWRNGDPGGGHMCVVFKGPAEAIFLRGAEVRQAATPAALWEQLGAREAVTIPHHTASGHDWTHHDPRFQPLVEIYSDWGSSEFAGNPWWAQRNAAQGTSVQDALARGYRLGFVASGDDHTGLPGRTGLAAVWAESLSADALWAAWRARRTYATTGARIILRFSADGHPMGSEYMAPGPPLLELDVTATAPLVHVEILRDGVPVHTWTARGPAAPSTLRLRWTDEDLDPAPERYYYVRVRQADGHLAWCSPIWIRRQFSRPIVHARVEQADARLSADGATRVRVPVHNQGLEPSGPIEVRWYAGEPRHALADRPHQLGRPAPRPWTMLPGAQPAVSVWRQRLDDRRVRLFVAAGADTGSHHFLITARLLGFQSYRLVPHRLDGDDLELSDHFWDKHPLGSLDLWQMRRRGEARYAALTDDDDGTVTLEVTTEPRDRVCLELIVERPPRRTPPSALEEEPGGESKQGCHAVIAAQIDGEARPDRVWFGTAPAGALPLRVELERYRSDRLLAVSVLPSVPPGGVRPATLGLPRSLGHTGVLSLVVDPDALLSGSGGHAAAVVALPWPEGSARD